MSNWPRLLIVSAAAAIVLSLLFGLLGVAFWFGIGSDTADGLGDIPEARAIEVFRQNGDVCEQLRHALGTDHVDRSIHDLPGTRRAHYERLLGQLGAYDARSGRSGSDAWECEIDLARYGNFFHCAYISFVHVPTGIAPPDRPPVGDDPDFERFTRLGGGWFLRYMTQ